MYFYAHNHHKGKQHIRNIMRENANKVCIEWLWRGFDVRPITPVMRLVAPAFVTQSPLQQTADMMHKY